MAKPPAGSSLLFGALADSGQIKQRKNGSYRMVLKGVDEIDWFTDRPDRVEGTWKPQKLLRKWDNLFATSEPNAQATVEVGDQRELFTFEMFKPKIKSGKMVFGVKPLSDSSEDKITGLKDMKMSDISLFIDDATPGVPSCFPYCRGADLKGWDMSGQKLYSDFSNADLSPRGETATNLSGADLTGADLTNADLTGADLTDAVLNDANLNDADLTNANLSRAMLLSASLVLADLTSADLTNADLFDASLGDADLSGADLTNADLTNADLTDAGLGNANLTGADLTGAYLAGAYLGDANLTGAIWANTTCPDSYTNSGTSPCTAEQLNLA